MAEESFSFPICHTLSHLPTNNVNQHKTTPRHTIQHNLSLLCHSTYPKPFSSSTQNQNPQFQWRISHPNPTSQRRLRRPKLASEALSSTWTALSPSRRSISRRCTERCSAKTSTSGSRPRVPPESISCTKSRIGAQISSARRTRPSPISSARDSIASRSCQVRELYRFFRSSGFCLLVEKVY